MSKKSGAGKPLRFASLIRVSTEKQERKGESLRTQTNQIAAAVKSLGGRIVAKFGGQEHGTAGWEREELNKLLQAAAQQLKPFDAVIVADPTRWSRDNGASEKGLEQLRDCGVRFYVLTKEYNLFDPQDRFFLALSTTIGAFHARTQRQKSLLNRLYRARRGLPTCGKKPFGRVWDEEKEKWRIDPEKQSLIVDVAERYLAGESLPKLAKECSQNHSYLTKVLRERCGDRWTITFQDKEFDIDETVTFSVPRLLPEKTIRAILQRLEANRTYLHGRPKNNYLLAGRVFCAECGYAMFGQRNRHDHLYYRHSSKERARECPLKDPRPWVRADVIEAAVVRDLFNMFGNPSAIERAVRSAIPDCDKLLKQKARLEEELAKIERARDRVLNLVEKEALTDKQAEKKLIELKEREVVWQAKLDKLSLQLSSIPDPKTIRQTALHVIEVCDSIFIEDDEGNRYAGGNDVQSFLMMDEKDKRALIEKVLSGNLLDGRPAGVYITSTNGNPHGPKQYRYTIRGLLCGEIRGVTQNSYPWPAATPPARRSSSRHFLAAG